MLNILLESTNTDAGANSWTQWIILIVLVLVFVVMFWFTGRSNKKKQKEQQEILNSIRPGNKVTTIGGITGIVVDVNPEEGDGGTFVLETGSEAHGKCYIKFVKQAIWQTDAKAAPKAAEEEPKTEEAEAAQTEEQAPAAEEVKEPKETKEAAPEENKN